MNRTWWPLIVASLIVAAGLIGSALVTAAWQGSAWTGLGASGMTAAAMIAGVLIMVTGKASAYPVRAVAAATVILVAAIMTPAGLSLAGAAGPQQGRHLSILGSCAGIFVVTLSSRGCDVARPGWAVIATSGILAAGVLIASLSAG
jgi:hypothetical protein